MSAAASSEMRLRVRVSGAVQGVGFRPYVYGLAMRYGLAGFVTNGPDGVIIEVEGHRVSEFVATLPLEAPPLSRIEDICVREIAALAAKDFSIGTSEVGRLTTQMVADTAVCQQCLDELFDPENRHYLYPFISCCHCGPRYTIAERLPYDRRNTVMKTFTLCAACATDYADPASRRFHAEAIACPTCGPRLSQGINAIVAAIASGQIVAIKGLGGYQLLCDANNQDSVERLRRRKHRLQKPFAVMVESIQRVGEIAEASAAELALLESVARPIVLLRSRNNLAPAIAPDLSRVGVMLPVAPLHHLILRALRSPDARERSGPVIVATSANLCGEPLLIDNAQALRRLERIADLVVTHDRDILTRVDDSVLSVAAGGPQFIRRARGYVPDPIRLERSVPPVLAVGGALKSTVTVTRGNQAFVSQHIGDLNTAEGIRAFEKTIRHLTSSLDVEPIVIAHDLDPDMASTRFAEANARSLVAVQHHHAHAAAVIAEHGHAGPALALVLDGHGLGSEGGNWGGELLLCEGTRFRRIGHLAPLQMPGGDRAAREPWRMASAVLHMLGRGHEIGQRFAAQRQAGCLLELLDQPGGTATTSAGRLFDAAAALLGISNVQSYEGEAAMKLEALIRRTAILEAGWTINSGVLSLGPLLSRLIDDDVDAATGAELFHGTFAAACVDWVMRSARTTGVNTVVLSGGCFLNAVLSDKIPGGCRDAGLTPLVPRRLPPNDGGLSLGQAWIAALQIAQQSSARGGAI
ncbi:carbamoyltransferase [Bradyrhizobium nanningense]|uniref:Carbamoyltransferase HypF n=1 Tax=Bradyrhizobium nanningense TaxID=1325118 RepID=A0A4Q0SJD7_9BRAD|nr:carbamoyltransferase HypF [Bradyrhizobium nanningense]RXH38141.1 carbamoyltransferase [Bradyrhizobium nanningense]